MSVYITEDDLRRWGEEYAKRKEPIDSDIKERERRAGDPPKDAMPSPNGGIDPNPDDSNAPSSDLPQRGSKNQEKMTQRREGADSMDDKSAKPKLDDMQWQMGSYTLEAELDPQTGYAKWPLSFKRIEKDVKRPNKPLNPDHQPKVTDKSKQIEQPPTAV